MLGEIDVSAHVVLGISQVLETDVRTLALLINSILRIATSVSFNASRINSYQLLGELVLGHVPGDLSTFLLKAIVVWQIVGLGNL